MTKVRVWLVNARTVYVQRSCLYLSQYQTVTNSVKEGPCQASRRAYSWVLKGISSNREGHVLKSRERRADFLSMPLDFLFLYITISLGVLSRTEGSAFSHGGYFFLSQRVSFSITEEIFLSHRGYFFLSQNTQM